MTDPDRKFAALITSRICHDLISPIGAINNGLELMALAGAREGPELSLVSQSAAAADARVRLFRLAFGQTTGEEPVSAADMRSILSGVYHGPQQAQWHIEEPLPRKVAQACLLAMMCAADSIPAQGLLLAEGNGAAVRITAQGTHPQHTQALWELLDVRPAPPELSPSKVQFALLPALLTEIGRCASHSPTGNGVRIEF